MQTAAKGTGSVLIAGKGGAGKDLVAGHIHRNSSRAQPPFVPVNCGAIPKELFERELCGHKEGAFTGAVNETAGLFRSAEGGTIFLDEITEIPPESQVKLLRVLQDKHIRPLGSTEEIPLDVQQPPIATWSRCSGTKAFGKTSTTGWPMRRIGFTIFLAWLIIGSAAI